MSTSVNDDSGLVVPPNSQPIPGPVSISGNLSTTGDLAVGGNETIAGTLAVTGATTLAAATLASAAITGNETVAGTLAVTGVTTLAALASGAIVSSSSIKERARATAQGEWIAFTPIMTASAGTWTGGTVLNAKYMLVGKTMTINFKVTGSSVSTTPSTLIIAIPGGFTSAGEMGACAKVSDNGTVGEAWLATAGAAGTTIAVFKNIMASVNWAASAAATAVQFNVSFEIQ